MANYFVLDSKFTPYTFEELIKPYQLYNEAYKEQEAALDAAAENEFASANIGEGDTLARSLYDAATGKLSSLSEELATKGLTAGIRAKVKSTARDYKNTMNNLKTAQTNLNAERERRLKAGNNYVYQQENLGLDDFLDGRTPNQKSVNLDSVTKEISTKFAARAKSISGDTWSKVLDQNGNTIKGYYDVTTRDGLSAAQLDAVVYDFDNSVLNNDKLSDTEKIMLAGFRREINTTMSDLEYDKYGENARRSIDKAVILGAQAALGTTKHEYKNDKVFDQAPHWASVNLQREKWRANPNNPENPNYGKGKNGNKTGSGRAAAVRERNLGVTKYDPRTSTTLYHYDTGKEATAAFQDDAKRPRGEEIRIGTWLFGSTEGKRTPTENSIELTPRNENILTDATKEFLNTKLDVAGFVSDGDSDSSYAEIAKKAGLTIHIEGTGDDQRVIIYQHGTQIGSTPSNTTSQETSSSEEDDFNGDAY